MSEISIVIPTLNSKKFIKSCLASLFNQNCQDFEVIVVDNGSKDGTAEFIEGNYPQVILIKNEKNEGACKARNQGIEVVRGRYILTLDCDVVLEKNFLFQIKKTVDGIEDKVGMVAPKILKMGKKTIYSIGIYLSKFRRFYDIGREQLDNGQFNQENHIFGPCSAAALYKREMLENIKSNGGEYFDSDFFFLVEDVDLAWRAQKCGWKAVFSPKAICYHMGNSSRYSTKFRQYLSFRNRYLLMLKNDSSANMIKNLLFLMPYDGLRLFYMLFTNSLTIKGLKEVVRLSPKILKKRSKLLSRRTEIKAP